MATYTKSEMRGSEKIRAANTYTVHGYTLFLIREQLTKGYLKVQQIYPPQGYPQITIPFYDDEPYKVQTTSWGALPVDEINDVIKRYQTAVKVVKWLEKFNWDKTDIITD